MTALIRTGSPPQQHFTPLALMTFPHARAGETSSPESVAAGTGGKGSQTHADVRLARSAVGSEGMASSELAFALELADLADSFSLPRFRRSTCASRRSPT